ncbi:MAG: glycosyltransferase family 39 protein [Deltaproteobacteria bacterium]|nr:glycosyltransferase family 39 protein [Deltaproteobacteria bacterium]
MVGTDQNQNMLDVAQRKLGPGGGITFREMTAAEIADRWTGGRSVLAACLAPLIAGGLAALLLLPGLGATPLVNWDEGVYADVARGMFRGNWYHLEWNGEAYYRKPPLLFWSMALAYGTFGVNETGVRAPSALAGVGTAAVAGAVVAQRAGLPAALATTACLLGSTLFIERGGRRACTDSLAIFLTMVALARFGTEAGWHRRRLGVAIVVGLAILAKGPLGLLAPAAAFLASIRDRARQRDTLYAAFGAIAFALPWYALQLATEGTGFLAVHFGREIWSRAIEPIEGHAAPWWYPMWALWTGGGSWVVGATAAVALAALTGRQRRAALAPWFLAAVLVMAAATAVRTRLPWYCLPALPMLAVAGGMALGFLGSGLRARARLIHPAALSGLAIAALVAAPAARRSVIETEEAFESFRVLGSVISETLLEEPFVGATEEHPTLIFYGGRPFRFFEADELERRLLDPEAFPRAGLVPAERAAVLLEAGAVEMGRLGDLVLLRHIPL